MKCYDTQAKEIFEVTPEEYQKVMDDYQSHCQRDLIIDGSAPIIFTPCDGPVLKGHRYWVHKLNEEYAMIKFEDKYVHFRWSDELKGKKCSVADNLEELARRFAQGKQLIVLKEHSKAYPFETEHSRYQFCYYDPNLECKEAFNEGQQIQVKHGEIWCDIDSPSWDDNCEYRIKPYEPALKWTDLDVGDVIETYANRHKRAMVTAIDYDDVDGLHIKTEAWIQDKDLKDWTKVS